MFINLFILLLGRLDFGGVYEEIFLLLFLYVLGKLEFFLFGLYLLFVNFGGWNCWVLNIGGLKVWIFEDLFLMYFIV